MPKADGDGLSSSFRLSDFERSLGGPGAKLIERISFMARQRNLALYVAGGFVRDLLLHRGTLDLDFVLEGDAIGFARFLSKSLGGAVDVHTPFRTAKWILDNGVADRLSIALEALPASVDFVTARCESYARPAALPAVAPADIESDMRRRDFSVNALAIQLSPQHQPWLLVDVCDGFEDLKRGTIRALHEHSFVDDPTRILRALRYARRLEFDLEADTAAWIEMALPYLARTTGQRLSNEIGLILHETQAGETMLRLQELGALVNIHPAFRVNRQLPELLTRCQTLSPPWHTAAGDMHTLKWIALMSGISGVESQSLCEGLALTKKLTEAITASARLRQQICLLDNPDLRPSRVARLLDEFPDIALQANWLFATEKPAAQSLIAAYASDWRWRRPTISGDELIAMDLEPGPLFRQILERLRFAWIDCEICSAEDEAALLGRILEAKN